MSTRSADIEPVKLGLGGRFLVLVISTFWSLVQVSFSLGKKMPFTALVRSCTFLFADSHLSLVQIPVAWWSNYHPSLQGKFSLGNSSKACIARRLPSTRAGQFL
jgi:hypothetical protein